LALTVATLLKALRLFAKQTTDPLELLVQLNDDLKADLLPGQFVTVALMTLDLSDDSLTTVLAGHHPSLIVDPAGEIILKRTGKSGMGIGLTTGEPFRASLVAQQIFLEPGQTLLQYTDGVEEAKDPAEEEFGRSRVIGILGAGGTMEPQDLVDTLTHATVDHAEHHQVDDLTIFAIRREHEGM
jgi:sigma-B regulation protein RsbU (phosphoserine phosphatase)